MADTEDEERSGAALDDAANEDVEGEGEEKPKLNLEVQIEPRSACERHITVTIPRDDIDRYLDTAYSEMMDKAVVPGFRAGRAPRKLVQLRYRKEVADQVKGSLLMDSLGQIAEGHDLSPISEPDFDPTAVTVPESGPMTFEFDIEVRPEFNLPNWKGLAIESPVREFTAKDIDRQMKDTLAKHGRLVPHDGPAESGDYLTLNITFKAGENVISSVKEEVLRIRRTLSFRDGKVDDFDKLMKGVQAGQTRVGQAKLAADAPNEALRGKTISAEFEVLEVKKLELPELTKSFLEQIGDFKAEGDLRDALKDMLERRLQYEQQKRARQQILAALTEAANWELPPAMLKRQWQRELERAVLELRRSGFSDNEIRLRENELRQNSRVNTARALKEHFILERIAEDEKIEDSPDDYDMEIALIAQQSGESPRRVRAQLEKRNLMDTLRNQIIERKVIELIMEHATFKEVPYEMEGDDAEGVDQAAGGEEVEIPEAHGVDPGEAPHKAEQHTGNQ
ncbi:MAG TPA: trigger factor [Pirellulales bacterium]|jgi:trigger factor|nr:trigger factor [Pirellulales bacterium]